MSNEIVLSQLLQPLLLTKIFFLILIFAYIIFAIVIARQVRVMNNVVTEKQSSMLLSLLSIINVIAAISLFIVTLAIL